MTLTEDNYYVLLLAKQKSLFRALDRVDSLLDNYKKDLHNWDLKHKWDFNLLHDLSDRIKDRLNANYLVCCDWNWEVHRFNVIDLNDRAS